MSVVLAVLLLIQQGADRKRYETLSNEAYALFWRGRVELGDWCLEHGLFPEARMHYEFVRDGIGRHPLGEEVRRKLRDPRISGSGRADEETRSSYGRQQEVYYRRSADKFYEAYAFADSKGLQEEATDALAGTLQFHADHPGAHRALGEVRIEGIGWLPKGEADRLSMVDWGAESRSSEERAREDGRHAQWSDAWLVRTEHYLVKSNMSFVRVASVAQTLEKFYQAFWEAVGRELNPSTPPYGILYFKDDADYASYRQKFDRIPADRPGFYDAVRNVVAARTMTGRTISLWASDMTLLVHEATHQLVDTALDEKIVSSFQTLRRESSRSAYVWISEGIACYFETFVGGALGKRSPRMAILKGAVQNGATKKLAEFFSYDFSSFQNQDASLHYAQAYGLTLYCLSDPGLRRKYFELLRRFYRGEDSSFEKVFGTTPSRFEEPFLEFVRDYQD